MIVRNAVEGPLVDVVIDAEERLSDDVKQNALAAHDGPMVLQEMLDGISMPHLPESSVDSSVEEPACASQTLIGHAGPHGIGPKVSTDPGSPRRIPLRSRRARFRRFYLLAPAALGSKQSGGAATLIESIELLSPAPLTPAAEGDGIDRINDPQSDGTPVNGLREQVTSTHARYRKIYKGLTLLASHNRRPAR